MKRGAKISIVVSALVLLLAAGFAFVYFVVLDTFILVSDSSLNQVVPAYCMKRTASDFASKGFRLKVKTLDDRCFQDTSLFTSEIAKIKGAYVLLGPLSSYYALQNGIDVSALLPNSKVLGIGGKDMASMFDCCLDSDERTGWVKAAEEIAKQTASMAQNIGIVYDSGSISYSEDIISCFGSGRVSSFVKEGSSLLFPSRTIDEMNRLGIVLALCPYLEDFNSFFTKPGSVSWIVDYRLSSVVPEDNLYGVVIPDMAAILDLAETVGKGERRVVDMEYCYEKR